MNIFGLLAQFKSDISEFWFYIKLQEQDNICQTDTDKVSFFG